MTFKHIALAAILTTLATPVAAQTAAPAQPAFTGQCADYTPQGKAACIATAWCRWSERKPIALPNGHQFTPRGVCAFKPHYRQGLAQSRNS